MKPWIQQQTKLVKDQAGYVHKYTVHAKYTNK